MLAVINRIHEIKKRFGMMRHNVESPQSRPFEAETQARLKELQMRESADGEPTLSNAYVKRPEDYSRGEIRKIAKKYARINKVPSALVNAVIEAESSFNPAAVSPKGAQGLMQLMPATARSLNVSDPFMPEENIRGGVALLRRLLGKYDGDYKKALAAYNAGEGAVAKYGGIPPYKETREYVKKVINAYLRNSE